VSGPTVAFAGAAHSHPFTDAANLIARGAAVTGVWEADDAARRDAFTDRFGVPAAPSLAALLASAPDLVVATPRTPRAPEVLSACARMGIPVFFNKTVAAGPQALSAFEAAEPTVRYATSSVLRFAPAVQAFAAGLGGARIRAVDVVAQHEIAGFLAPQRAWQDDPAVGGGTLLSVGVHALDLADAVLPAAPGRPALAGAILADAWSTRGDLATRSETVAVVSARTAAGIALTATISGVDGPDRYAVRVVADDGVHELSLGDGDDLGYGGLADALIAFAAGGPAPVQPARSLAGYRLLLDVAERTRGLGESG
jgi:predicted dehydrogenase